MRDLTGSFRYGPRFFKRCLRARIIAALLVCIGVSPALADMAPRTSTTSYGDVRVEVEEIRHLGCDDFRVELSFVNSSGAEVFFESVDRTFSVQTETGWLSLREKDIEDGIARKVPVPAGEIRKTATTVIIPRREPRLFRTYEGDISLSLRYELRFVRRQGRTPNVEKRGEEYYWINPDSGKWIHREGM